jgi:hypothetical protein
VLRGNILIDRLTIRQAEAEECLPLDPPGAVLNGDAEPLTVDQQWWEGASWDFRFDSDAQNGFAYAGFEADKGQAGSIGVKVAREADETGRATATTQISVPVPADSLPSPALKFWWRGSSPALFDVELGTRIDLDDRGRHVDTLAGTGSRENYIYCLPPWTHGSVLDLSFSLRDDNSTAVELVIDDVSITSDSDCVGTEDILDPGFESAPNRWFGGWTNSRLATVALELDQQLAHNGSNGLLAFSYENGDAELFMETYVLVPSVEVEQEPLLTFYSRAPATVSTTVEWVLGLDESETGPVKTDAAWKRNEVYLPRRWAGRWYRLQVRVGSPEGLLGRERLLLDDFSVAPAPSRSTE